jgi:uncharacterized alkaline shock family protein YloU
MIQIDNSKGSIRISGEVITNIAGDAATKCFGVKGMVGHEKKGDPFQLLRRESMSKGVEIRLNDDNSISLDLHIGVDQGVNVIAAANSIINEVSYKVQKATSMTIKDVNVYIDTVIG